MKHLSLKGYRPGHVSRLRELGNGDWIEVIVRGKSSKSHSAGLYYHDEAPRLRAKVWFRPEDVGDCSIIIVNKMKKGLRYGA